MQWLLSFIISLYGGLALRLHGGGFLKPRGDNKRSLPKVVLNIIVAWPFGVVSYLLLDNCTDFSNWITVPLSLISFALCLGGRTTGHGAGIDYGTMEGQPRKLEKLEFTVRWLYGIIPHKWYDHIFLSVTGLAAVSGAAIISLICGQYLLTTAFILGGILKGTAYQIGWRIYPSGNGRGLKNFNEATQIAEFLTGVFAYIPIALTLWTLYGESTAVLFTR